MTSIPLGFGGIERTVDERDFQLGSYQIPGQIPPAFIQSVSDIPVFYQGTYGTCGAHAGSFFDSKLQSDRQRITRILSPKFLWAMIKQIDGFSLEEGTDMRSIFRSLIMTGNCDLALFPNSLDVSVAAYSAIKNVTDLMRLNGYQNQLKNYAFTNNPTFDQIKQAIYKNKAVIALVDIGDGWWLPDWAHVLPIKLGSKVGHHFIVLHSYDEKYIYFRNSWGPTWGNKGDGYFDISYVTHVLEIGTSIILPNQFIFTKDLQRGDSGNDVTQLQRRLNVEQVSYFGPLTQAAVKIYQISHGITPISGYCGMKTRFWLNTTLD